MADNERPVTVAELCKLISEHPPGRIQYVTRKMDATSSFAPSGPGNRRSLKYLPSEVRKECGRVAKRARPSNTVQFIERGVTWIAEELLPVHRETADRMASLGTIAKPRTEPLQGPTPWYRKFWPREDIEGALNKYSVPKCEQDKVRTAAEVERLGDDEYLSGREAGQFGFGKTLLRVRGDLDDPRRRHAHKPFPPFAGCPETGLIRGQWKPRISEKKALTVEPTWRLGDLRAYKSIRDNPPVPDGGILLRDAIRIFRQHQLNTVRSSLVKLIQSKKIRGGQIDCLKKNFSPQTGENGMWWMMWADRLAVPDGARVPETAYKPTGSPKESTSADDLITPRLKRTSAGWMRSPETKKKDQALMDDWRQHKDAYRNQGGAAAFAKDRGYTLKTFRRIQSAEAMAKKQIHC
ncbi:MAG: hypothetical protein ABSH08_13915 [Tepidisphaeraceae bacterium]|jgi:hypothetical protein